jgi:hypothetical protein
MAAIGVDVARGGGQDDARAARELVRHAEALSQARARPTVRRSPSSSWRTGRDDAVVNIDVIAVGSSPYDCLRTGGSTRTARSEKDDNAVPMNGAEKSDAKDKSRKLGFVNQRAEWYWKLREDSRSGERPGSRAAARSGTEGRPVRGRAGS